MIVIADDSKFVETLGSFPLPIEVNAFGLAATRHAIAALASELGLSGDIDIRQKGAGPDEGPYITDGGHLILDASFGRIPKPKALAIGLNQIPGVVEHGLFIGLANRAILAGEGGIQTLVAPN